MGKYFINLIAGSFILSRFRYFYRIVKQVINKIISCYCFGGLRFLRMKGEFFFQLLNAIAFSRLTKTLTFHADVPVAGHSMDYRALTRH